MNESRLCLATSPDSWGIWFAEDEHQMPCSRFLDEVAEAGYHWVELGPYGYLPTDPRRLREELDQRGLRLSGGLTFGALHRPEKWDEMLAEIRLVAELAAALEAHHVVLVPPLYRDERTGAWRESPQLTDRQRAGLHHAANELGRILLADYGVRLCLHPHADCHIQTPEEIEQFLDGTDQDLVSLCLDTGHVAYGGGDNIDLIQRFPDRIGYVHFKQLDEEIRRQVMREELSFGEAVKRGVFVEMPGGVPEPAPLISELNDLDKPLFVIAEQDLYPCAPDVPLPIAIRTRKFLNDSGLHG
jgi:sugar phosphate isomerase/epimerase